MQPRARCLVMLVSILCTAAATAAEPAAASPQRRLVLCLDGTQNSPEQDIDSYADGTKLFKPTNVLKTFRAIYPVHGGVSQIAYYSEGVGSLIGEPTRFAAFAVFVDRFLGGAFGVGYEPRVKAAYRFLVANYQPGDEIFVFGFSRGAAEAQTLARFVEWVGGVLPDKDVGGILKKEDEYYIPELYDGFKRSQMKPYSHEAPGKAQAVFKKIRDRRGGRPDVIGEPQPAQIEFLGVYDTVVSIGSRLAPDGEVTTVAEEYAYLVDKIPPKIVKTIRQALSIDERRWDFRPQVWQPEDDSLARSEALVQRWFPGVHSNVGGGFRYDGLADRALAWMIDEANKAERHVAFDPDYLKNFTGQKRACYEPSRPDSYTLLYRIAEAIRFKSGRGVRRLATWDQAGSWERSGLGFDKSVGELLISDCTYRPRNLLEYLAQHPERIAQFPVPSAQQTEIREIVEDFKARAGQRNPKPYHCRPPLPCGSVATSN